MVMSAAKVSLGNWSHAIGAVAELDTAIAARKIGAYQIFPVLSVFGNDKVGSLKGIICKFA